MRTELELLREEMRKAGITAWISPCSDAHGSEYIGAHDQCVKFLTGFTGDSCTVLVTDGAAYLWTDGRYFVQAEKELTDSGVELMKMGEPGVPTLEQFLRTNLSETDTLGFDARLVSAKRGRNLKKIVEEKKAALKTDTDLVDLIWKDRPERNCTGIRVLDIKFAGEDASEKIGQIREEMHSAGADLFLTGALDETAWLTNLRGSDIECNPVFLSYMIISEDDAKIWLQKEALTKEAKAYLKAQKIEAKKYDHFGKALEKISGKRILIDTAVAGFGVIAALWKGGNTILDCVSPAAVLKSVKNPTEAACLKACHIRDGAYMTKYLCWLDREIKKNKNKDLSETDVSDVLDGLRAEDPNYLSLSFPTISAYGENAALPHYMAKPETAVKVLPKGLYLCDSGVQYLDGTTDVTRTVALGETTEEERRDYTLTVIGMLRLMHAVFPYGARGMNLDTFARQPLWEHGIDFNHGTGHGVGFVNNVHEGPAAVRFRPNADPRRDRPFVPGMVTSDEPGVYVEGSHGIRTENMILCVPHPEYEGFFTFEPLTMVPLDPEPLEVGLMSERDIEYYNDYQKLVRETVGPLLTEEEREWLEDETAEIGNGKKDRKHGKKKDGKRSEDGKKKTGKRGEDGKKKNGKQTGGGKKKSGKKHHED